MRFHAFTSEAAPEIGVRRSPVSALQSSQQSPRKKIRASRYLRAIRRECKLAAALTFSGASLLISSLLVREKLREKLNLVSQRNSMDFLPPNDK